MLTTLRQWIPLIGLLTLLSVSSAETLRWPLPDEKALAEITCPAPDQRLVAAHYFYWYDWPNEHFFNDQQHQSTALRQHPPDPSTVSYRSKAWHRKQFEDMQAAGIDTALCIYWGAPENYERADILFSIDGLPPMAAALDELAAEGKAPKLALFYDTSSLLLGIAKPGPMEHNIDLRTAEGRDIFYRTIRDFYCQIPPRHWACIDGRPIVQFYAAGHAAGHDQRLLDEVYARFAADFGGKRPYIIAGPSWQFLEPDARVGWGAALSGPLKDKDVMQIGAGYDDSPVPGRTTPARDRVGGAFYSAGWLSVIRAQPRLVILETWNEWHEGTGISDTLEDGRRYIELTRKYSDRFRAGASTTTGEWVALVDQLLRAQHSTTNGRAYANNRVLEFAVGEHGELIQHGLRLDAGQADGRFEITQAAGKACVQGIRGVSPVRFLYFDVADNYYFDHCGDVLLEVTYLAAGSRPIEIDYDRAEAEVTPDSRYRRPRGRTLPRSSEVHWQTKQFLLRNARFGNGENGGCDFRLVSENEDFTIARVRLTKLWPAYPQLGMGDADF